MKQGKKQIQKKRINIGAVGLTTYLLGLLFRLPLGYLIGDQGVAFFSVGMELLVLINCITGYGISKSVTIAVKYRIRREQYKNARKIFGCGMLLGGGISLLLGAALLFFSEWVGTNLFLNPLAYLPVAAIAPAVFLMSLIGIWRGYYLGMGSVMPVIHSKWIEKILLIAVGLILAFLLYRYGLKVAALLQGSQYAYAYGGFGASLGVSVLSLLSLLHLWLISMLVKGPVRQKTLEPARATETGAQVAAVILATALPYIAMALIYQLSPLVDLILYWQTMKKTGEVSKGILHWGIYYGKYTALAGLPAILILISAVKRLPVIMRSFEQHDMSGAQHQVKKMIHQLVVLSAFFAVIFAVTAQSLTGMLSQKDAVITGQIFQAGAIIVFLFPLVFFLGTLLTRTRKTSIVLGGGALSLVVHIVLLLVLLNSTKLGICGVVLGQDVFYLTALLLFLYGVNRALGVRLDWIRTFGVTGIAAGVTGLIGILIQKGLLMFAGNLISFLLTLLFCLLIYPLLILLLKGVNTEELEVMPGGRLINLIGEKLRLL